MSVKPREATWGVFYRQLDQSAERLKGMMKNTPHTGTIRQDETARGAGTKAKSQSPGLCIVNSNMPRRGRQKRGANK